MDGSRSIIEKGLNNIFLMFRKEVLELVLTHRTFVGFF